MTPDDVRKRVAMIQDTAGDDESAHSAEDRLYRHLLAHLLARREPRRAFEGRMKTASQRGYPHGKDLKVERQRRAKERAAAKAPPVTKAKKDP